MAMPSGPRGARRTYQQTTFKQLHQESDRLAAGMLRSGIRPGMPIVLMVPFSTSFIRWVFALLKSGAVMVLVRLWRYDNTIKLSGDQLLQCIVEE